MATTTNYSWVTPDDTSLVKDGAAAIRTLGSSIDTTTKALNPSTTLGDIEYRSATANTNTRLGIGTSGQVLAVNGSGVPAWTTVSSGGITQIATGSLGTGASFTISSIPSTYKDLVLFVSGYFPSTAANRIDFYLNGDTASKYRTAVPVTAFSDVNIDTAYTNIRLGANMANTGATNNRAIVSFPQYSQTVGIKRFYIDAIFKADGATTSWSNGYSSGLYDSTAAISSITLIPSAGNIGGGNYTLWGIN
jgi:hypothetical protein